jgi:hypothetical protein
MEVSSQLHALESYSQGKSPWYQLIENILQLFLSKEMPTVLYPKLHSYLLMYDNAAILSDHFHNEKNERISHTVL